ANALQDLGRVQTELRDVTAAADSLARSRALFAEVGDSQGEAEALNSTGALLARSGEPRRALDTYQQALRLARQVGSPLDEAHALEGIARCQAHTDTQAAITSLREAVTIYQRIGVAETATATDYLTQLEAEQA
ncbi:tetratricopeptide repeat protein, partial [Streptomyces antimycoticus]|uniref:tetratricopeptide repeat protein n=1 Tax=Streptomyces antimycoticus TaxID=68175 RepID=UPI0033D151A0